MKVAEVLRKYYKQVPFPWSVAKIKRAKYNPIDFLIHVGRDLEKCDDIGSDTGTALITMLKEMEMFL